MRGPSLLLSRVADLFILGMGEGVRRASAARAAGSLLRNVRVGGGGGVGGGQEGKSAVSETASSELYRLFDVTTSVYHSSQTEGVPSGVLVFVRQASTARSR